MNKMEYASFVAGNLWSTARTDALAARFEHRDIGVERAVAGRLANGSSTTGELRR
jgi:hypothetical protein